MTIPLLSTGGLFTRVGKEGVSYLRVVASYGTTLDDEIQAIRDQFDSGDQGVVIDGIYATRNAYKTVHTTYLSALQTMAQNTAVEMANDDTRLVSKTLTNALTELIRQMKASSDSILRGTTAASVTAFSGNKGDGKFLFSFTNKYGDPLQFPYPETITFNCTTDSTNFAEVFTYAGQTQKAITDATWPGGSGASGSITLTNGASNGILTNGNFADWSSPSAPPASWTFTTGTAGTSIVRDTSTKRTSSGYALQMVGDGSIQQDIKQQLTGVTVNQVLCFQAWAKMSAADANAVLRVRLIDGAGSVINNDAGNANSATFDCNSTIGTSYTSISTFFQLPRQLPSTGVFLQISISSGAIDSGKSLNLSLMSVREAVQTYPAGPYVAAFSAALAHSVGDYFTVAVTNDVTNATWVRATQRWWGMDRLGEQYYLPSVASSPTIDDNLLT